MNRGIKEKKEKNGFLCDMDGVIYRGNELIDGAAEFVRWLKKNDKKFLFFTNSGKYEPSEIAAKLQRMGLDVDAKHIYTSSLATAEFLKNQSPGCTAFVVASHGTITALHDAGVTFDDHDPEYVVIGEPSEYSLDKITKAINMVNKGAKLIGTNSDLTGPGDGGIVLPACRALIAPIELATGKQAYFLGKPNPLMMRTGLKLLGVHSSDAAMIGDRMDTDIIAGMETGLDTVLVLSGMTNIEEMKRFPFRPTYVMDSVGNIPDNFK